MPRPYRLRHAAAFASWPARGSAFAQATEFYVVQDTRTKRCTVVDKRPSPSTYVTVVSDGFYKTQEEAEAGIQSVKVCTGN